MTLRQIACAAIIVGAASQPALAAPAAVSADPAPASITPAPAKAAPAKESLALIAVSRGEGFTEKQGSTIEELLLNALDATGRFKVVGRTDIDAVLSLEAKKQSAGCSDTDCAVQIAGALGVDLVATANVGRLGVNTLLTLKVVSVRSASVVARGQQSVQSDSDLPNAARALADQIVASRFGVAMPVTTPAPKTTNGAFVATWVLLGVGAAAAVVASVTGGTVAHCPTVAATPDDAVAAHQCQTTFGTAANISWGVAGASAIAGGVLLAVWLPKAIAPEQHKIAVNFSLNSIGVAGQF